MKMARAVTLGLLVAVAPAARAQLTGMRVFVGPLAGATFSTFSLTNAPGVLVTARTGFMAGAALQATLPPGVFMRIGAFYAQRGSNVQDPSGNSFGGDTGRFKVKLNYVEIPVLVGFIFGMQGSPLQPYVMAGSQFAFKAGCNVTAPPPSGSGASTDCNTAYGSTLASTDVGLTVGAGIAVPAGKGSFMVDARYLVGLNNLTSAGGGGEKVKNQGFTIAAGYMISVGH